MREEQGCVVLGEDEEEEEAKAVEWEGETVRSRRPFKLLLGVIQDNWSRGAQVVSFVSGLF